MIHTAIEQDFPFEQIDPIADRESWRKEINRPLYHIHKWWANRLGSVFRAIILGTLQENKKAVWDGFYEKHNFSNKIVLDPFMGSGTTLGESLKLGAKVIGCDINPVSSFIVRQALQHVDHGDLLKAFKRIEKKVSARIQSYYETVDPSTGERCRVLYYFWVKIVNTPEGEEIPLFSDMVFSRNAYPSRKPDSQILCPHCWGISVGRFDSEDHTCPSCKKSFNPQVGTTISGHSVASKSGQKYKIGDLVRAQKSAPDHRLYALMVLDPSGNKRYLRAGQHDLDLLKKASEDLHGLTLPLPTLPVRAGNNTDQARSYNYFHWREFFNDRQLLCLGLLLQEILLIEDRLVRDHFLCLFSGTLEFNNLFCSFKGEGTGAVRHMFSNHILKPERTPLENSVWGVDGKSSGTFSTLFRSRLLKAKEYLDRPFELSADASVPGVDAKIYCNPPIRTKVTQDLQEFEKAPSAALVLNGDSSSLPLPDNYVDAVVTDPPYFDFVHYSELSDFFYAWLSEAIGGEYPEFKRQDSSSPGEVQDKSPKDFARNLGKVFTESARVLKPEGVLVFSFHHSRPEGWLAIYEAISASGLQIAAAHPVKAEMSGGSPKTAAKHPINLDAIMVCKKGGAEKPSQEAWEGAVINYRDYIRRFEVIGRSLSLGDRRVILASQVLKHCSLAALSLGSVEIMLLRVFCEFDF